jgi:glycosyltransferase involved in cell wall biosynthesis
MKIAEVCPRYHPYIGGVETTVQEISERMVKAGHAVDVITTLGDKNLAKHEIINGVNINRFNAFILNDSYFISPEMYFHLKSHNYDIVHAHSYNAFPAAMAALAKKGAKKFVFTSHYHPGGHTDFRTMLHVPYSFIGNYVFSKADQVLCDSEFEKRIVDQTFNVSRKSIMLPIGINTKDFDKFKDSKKDKSRQSKVILCVGRLEEYKGIQNIIQCLPELSEATLRVVGKGNYAITLHDLAESLRINQRIEWYSDLPRTQLVDMYADADVYVTLSSHEAYGITVAEALLAGTPCVVARGSALEEFIDNKTCLGVDLPINKDELISSIRKLYDEESRYQGKIYDWDEVTDRLLTIFSMVHYLPYPVT